MIVIQVILFRSRQKRNSSPSSSLRDKPIIRTATALAVLSICVAIIIVLQGAARYFNLQRLMRKEMGRYRCSGIGGIGLMTGLGVVVRMPLFPLTSFGTWRLMRKQDLCLWNRNCCRVWMRLVRAPIQVRVGHSPRLHDVDCSELFHQNETQQYLIRNQLDMAELKNVSNHYFNPIS